MSCPSLFRQLFAGVDTLKFVSSQLESIDRITEVPPPSTDSWPIEVEICGRFERHLTHLVLTLKHASLLWSVHAMQINPRKLATTWKCRAVFMPKTPEETMLLFVCMTLISLSYFSSFCFRFFVCLFVCLFIVHTIISAFWLAESMSIYPKPYKKLKLRVQNDWRFLNSLRANYCANFRRSHVKLVIFNQRSYYKQSTWNVTKIK